MLVRRALLVLLILCGFTVLSCAHHARAQPPQQPITLGGRVRYANDMSEASSVRVRLLEAMGIPITETFTDSRGTFEFGNLRPAQFMLEVSTEGYEVIRQSVDLSSMVGSRVHLTMLLVPSSQVAAERPPDGNTASQRELQVPKKARKAFVKGLRELNEKDRPGRSVSHFQKAIELYLEYDEAYVQLSLAYLSQGMTVPAQETLERALAVNQENARAHAFLGIVYREQEEMQKSAQALQTSVTLEARDWLTHMELGKALLKIGKIEEAYEHARRAQELNPEPASVYFLLSDICIRRRDYETALAELEGFLELDPQNPSASRMRQQRERLALFAQASSYSPDELWEMSMGAARRAYDRQDYDQAESFLQVALEEADKFAPKDPRPAANLSLLANVFAAQRRYAEAERHHKRSLVVLGKTLGPEHPFLAVTLNNLAELYRSQGQYGEAEPLYGRSLAILEKTLGPDHPNLATSLMNYSALLRVTNRVVEAEEMEVRAKAILAKHARTQK